MVIPDPVALVATPFSERMFSSESEELGSYHFLSWPQFPLLLTK